MTRSKPKTDLIVALDYPKGAQALQLVDQLAGLPVIYKVGFELFIAEGPLFVRELVQKRGQRVFLDLKLYDIPNTVQSAVRQACELEVDLLTLHLSGGEAMIRGAMQEVQKFYGGQTQRKTRLLGVSVLTSFQEEQWGEVADAISSGHRPLSTKQSVQGLVRLAEKWGIDGVVCSAHELKMVGQMSTRLYSVVPGIRPAGSDAQDQARVMTPEEASKLHAGAIVMGRPITGAQDPRQVVQQVLDTLCQS